jgi:ABC-type multidrug transport system ATPase subunit
MFDKLYVLAKGGICVFSGCPQDLKSHLEENDLICNEIQVPIEVSLKHSSNRSKDNYVISLAEKAFNENKTVSELITNLKSLKKKLNLKKKNLNKF